MKQLKEQQKNKQPTQTSVLIILIKCATHYQRIVKSAFKIDC